MRLKKYTQLFTLSAAMAVLVACSTTGGNNAPIDNLNDHSGSAEGGPTKITGAGADTTFHDHEIDHELGDKSGATSGLTGCNLKVGPQIYYFDFNESVVHEADKKSLEVQAHYLATHSAGRVLLEGNTDPRGSAEYNIALGERRAQAVASVLKAEGASDHQIQIISYGKEKLASDGTSDSDYALDRRTVLSYRSKLK